MKWHEIPLVHSPAFQKVQGLAQEPVVLDTRATVGVGACGGAVADGSWAPEPAAAARAGAALAAAAAARSLPSLAWPPGMDSLIYLIWHLGRVSSNLT